MENPTQLHLPVLTPGPGASLPADLLRQPWLVPGGNLPPFGGPCVVGVPPTVLSRQFHPLGPHHPAGVLTTGKGTNTGSLSHTLQHRVSLTKYIQTLIVSLTHTHTHPTPPLSGCLLPLETLPPPISLDAPLPLGAHLPLYIIRPRSGLTLSPSP